MIPGHSALVTAALVGAGACLLAAGSGAAATAPPTPVATAVPAEPRATTQSASPPFSREARIAYLRDVLAALRSTDARVLARARSHIITMKRSACSSPFERLRVECIMTVARRYCRDHDGLPRCRLYADVIAANALAEDQFIPAAQRYLLLQHSSDPRAAVDRELLRLTSELAVDLHLSSAGCVNEDAGCLAASIDRFCGASSDERHLPWQSCAGALVWLIGTTAGSDPGRR
jgi:hypothetical protein